ncbi:putative isomerase YbhE [Atractiella rhizophila]|nr:putative isomerase YbhE [Atractiella rhizophila]
MVGSSVILNTLVFATSLAFGRLKPVPRRGSHTIFAGTYNQQLLAFTFDTNTEKLALAGNTSTTAPFNNPSPSWLERTGSATKFLVTDESAVGQIQLVAAESNKSVALVASTSSGGNGPAWVGATSDGDWAIAANYGDGTVLPIPLKEDGTFASSSQPLITFTGATASHPHQTVELPGGSVLINDLGLDLIHEIALNDAGVWEVIGNTQVSPTGSGPRHGALSDDGKVYYLVTEEANELQIFTVDESVKPTALTHVSSTSILPPGAVPYSGFILGAGELLRVGNHIYISNRNQNTTLGDAIAIFELTSPTTVSAPTFVRTGGQHVRGMQFDSTDCYLIAGNMIQSPYAPQSVVAFRRDTRTGGLTLVDTLPVPGISVTGFWWQQ